MQRRLRGSILVFCFILLMTAGNADTTSVNINATIRDSVSMTPIPQVRVTIHELAKSFNTNHSSFVIGLPVGIYTIVLESPEYETLRRTFKFVEKNNELIFELVRIADRALLKKKGDPFYVLLDSLAIALRGMDWPLAVIYRDRIVEYKDPPLYNADSLVQTIQAVKTKILDSMMAVAKAALDSQKLADAYYYYKKVVEYDSTNEIARQKVAELFVPRPEVQQPPASAVPDVEIETLCQQGVSKFIAGEYDEAEKIFKRILAISPNHEKAKEYLHRTQTRIKALKQ